MIFKLRKNNGYPNVQFSLHEYKYPKRVSLQSLYIKCNALSKLCLIKVVLPRIFHILSIYLSPEKHLRLDWKHTSNAKIWSSIQEYVFTNLAYLKLQKLNLSLL